MIRNYIKVDKGGYCRFDFIVKSFYSFVTYSTLEYYYLGIFYGFLIIMAIYNLIMYLTARDGAYLSYVLMLAAGALKTLAEDRIGAQLLWPFAPHLSYYMGIHIAPNLLLLAFIAYTFSFLQSDDKIQFEKRIIWSTSGIYFAFYLGVLILFGDRLFADALYFLPYLTILILSIRLRVKQKNISMFFIIGTAFFLISIIADELRHLHLIIGSIVLVYSFHVSIVIQSIVLSVSIYDRLKFLQEEKKQLLINQIETDRLHYANLAKMRYYTDMSHELKTHLTLILSPLSEVLRKVKKGSKEEENLMIASSNAERVLRFTDSVLNVKKIEDGKLTVEYMNGDIGRFTEEIVHSFKGYARSKEISIHVNINATHLLCSFDAVKMEKILFNLLSNAIQYTENDESITVTLTANHEDNSFKIEVADTGRGIDKSDLDKVFTRFYQTSNTKQENFSVGIGLEFTHRLVELLGGSISVQSELGQGSIFTVEVPTQFIEVPTQFIEVTEREEETVKRLNEDATGFKILIVEDNDQLRHYIENELANDYNIVSINNAEQAWDLVLIETPDLVITDIQTPGNLSGLDLCKKIKTTPETNLIPVIILSGKREQTYLSIGLEYGASSYIVKPFNMVDLKVRIVNTINQNQQLLEKYSQKVTLEPTGEVIDTSDQDFLNQAMQIVEENIANSEFGVNQFCFELGISRAQLYRKFKKVTNQSVKEFIREIRIKKAAQLLKNTSFPIKQVMQDVGFTNRQYFINSFRNQFGELPSAYKNKSD